MVPSFRYSSRQASFSLQFHFHTLHQDDWDLIARMVQAATEAVTIPISCKIRVFPEVEKTVRYAEALVSLCACLSRPK